MQNMLQIKGVRCKKHLLEREWHMIMVVIVKLIKLVT